MYQVHREFEAAPGVARLWRYMTFAKFASLLAEQALFFSNATSFDDKFEGSVSEGSIAAERAVFLQAASLVPEEQRDALHRIEASMSAMRKWDREHGAAINCWHENEHESAAMWSLYEASSSGVAICTTFERLCSSFDGFEHPVFIGRVQYVDYDTFAIPLGNTLVPLLHKRLSFSHEREVRAIISHSATVPDGSPTAPVLAQYVPVDLVRLVEAVYVAPQGQGWVAEAVKKTVQAFGFTFDVKHSDLARDPVL
jgi:hypothetical protein